MRSKKITPEQWEEMYGYVKLRKFCCTCASFFGKNDSDFFCRAKGVASTDGDLQSPFGLCELYKKRKSYKNIGRNNNECP